MANEFTDVVVIDSTCFAIDAQGQYTRKIGLGLAPNGDAKVNDFVANYVGEEINKEEEIQRPFSGPLHCLEKMPILPCLKHFSRFFV